MLSEVLIPTQMCSGRFPIRDLFTCIVQLTILLLDLGMYACPNLTHLNLQHCVGLKSMSTVLKSMDDNYKKLQQDKTIIIIIIRAGHTRQLLRQTDTVCHITAKQCVGSSIFTFLYFIMSLVATLKIVASFRHEQLDKTIKKIRGEITKSHFYFFQMVH